MIGVKCPACGLVDWNVGDCKRCGTSLVGSARMTAARMRPGRLRVGRGRARRPQRAMRDDGLRRGRALSGGAAQTTAFVNLDDEYTSLKLTGREPTRWVTTAGPNYGGPERDAALSGHEAYVVSGVKKEDGKDETLYFDTLTGLLLRVDFEPGTRGAIRLRSSATSATTSRSAASSSRTASTSNGAKRR